MYDAGLTLRVTLSREQMEEIARMVAAELPPRPMDRQKEMVERLGEACTKETAQREMNVSQPTLWRMIRDGRVKTCCNGERVDVRSLADYLDNREEIDRETRLEKQREAEDRRRGKHAR